MFERLRKSNPNALEKVFTIIGDVNTDDLGLNSATINDLVNEVNVVFHMAANLKLEANLKDALEQNTKGTARLLEICRKMKKLEAFLHFSTAFCSADITVFQEKVGKAQIKNKDFSVIISINILKFFCSEKLFN